MNGECFGEPITAAGNGSLFFIGLSIIKTTLFLKLNGLLVFKAFDNKKIESQLKKHIKDIRLKMDHKISMPSLHKLLDNKSKAIIVNKAKNK